MKNSRILLVGGTGYLGTHLSIACKDTYTVYRTGTQEKDAENYFRLDLCDKKSFEQLNGHSFDMVIILAARINGLGNSSLVHSDLDVNSMCYATFLQFLRDNTITRKIVYISSMTVYGLDNQQPVPETGHTAPLSVYGLSKLFAEEFTAFLGRNSHIATLVLRIPGLYGGNRQGGYIYNTLQACLQGSDILLSSAGLGYWETIEVNDLSQLICNLISKYNWSKPHEVYNVSYGEPTDFYETAYLIREYTGTDVAIRETGEKGYIPFYIDNSRLRNIISVNCNFRDSLKSYIKKHSA